MAGRRGVLGGLLGALGAQQAAASVGPPAVVDVPVGAVGAGTGVRLGMVAQQRGESPEEAERGRLLRQLIDDAWAQRRRMEDRLSLTGGIPPGVLACKSWKPWFQVQATLRWREEHMPEPRFFERVIYRQVFGRDPD